MPFLISPITSNTLLAAVVVVVLLVCAQSELLYIMHNIAALHVIPACDTAAPLSDHPTIHQELAKLVYCVKDL